MKFRDCKRECLFAKEYFELKKFGARRMKKVILGISIIFCVTLSGRDNPFAKIRRRDRKKCMS